MSLRQAGKAEEVNLVDSEGASQTRELVEGWCLFASFDLAIVALGDPCARGGLPRGPAAFTSERVQARGE
jgi:hypothetical protein